MTRKSTKPKERIIEDGSPAFDGNREFTHPAFAQVGISRISHGEPATLYGSKLRHNETIRIEILRSKMQRNLSRDWFFNDGRMPLIEIEMSASQFATMITNLNVGGGTPCTIVSFNSESIPEIAPMETIKESFDIDIAERVAEVADNFGKVVKMLQTMREGKSVRKGDVEAAQKLLEHIECDLSSNLRFVQESFAKAMEDNMAKAKIDFEAHVEGVVMGLGLDALKNKAPVLEGGNEQTKQITDADTSGKS